MKFEVKSELQYHINLDTTLIFNIHAMDKPQNILQETFLTSAEVSARELKISPEGNKLLSLQVSPQANFTVNYEAIVDNVFEIKDYQEIEKINISKLPPDVFTYLNPSRYCQSDKLYRLANNLFGAKADDFEKVCALTEWIHRNIEYLSGSTNSQTSAFDTVTEQAGVCRDFAHLGIALCRALTIPARYFTCYAYQLIPQDFHACFEAYINGEWLLFDATKLAPLNGMVKIATGRDAADAALSNIYGGVSFLSVNVSSDFKGDNFVPFYHDSTNRLGIKYL